MTLNSSLIEDDLVCVKKGKAMPIKILHLASMNKLQVVMPQLTKSAANDARMC